MAGRKDKNVVDYFPHSVITGKTLFIVENKFGHLGYSVWFKTLELLGSSENHYIDLREETDLLFLISKMKVTEEQLINLYNLFAKLGAIDSDLWECKIVFSENFIKNIEDAYKRRGNNVLQKYDLCTHKLNLSTHQLNKCLHKSTKESKVKESKEEEINKENIYRKFSHLKITFDEVEKLKEEYSIEKINEILDKIENYRKNTKYKSLYFTALQWLKKEPKKKELFSYPKVRVPL